MPSKITIIRHSPTKYNKQNIFMGELDIPVDSFDEKKINALRKVLLSEKYTSIYSSPLQRSFQTAKKIFDSDYNIIIDNRLTERNLGIWQGSNKEEIMKKYPKLFHSNTMDFYYTPECGEKYETMILRIVSFIADCCQNNSNILVFTHNGVFRVLKSLFTGIPLSDVFRVKEPFLEPQSFIIDDSLFTKIKSEPFYTVDKDTTIKTDYHYKESKKCLSVSLV